MRLSECKTNGMGRNRQVDGPCPIIFSGSSPARPMCPTSRQIDGCFPISARITPAKTSIGFKVTMAQYGDKFYARVATSSIDRPDDSSHSVTRADTRVGCGYWYGYQGSAHRNGRSGSGDCGESGRSCSGRLRRGLHTVFQLRLRRRIDKAANHFRTRCST